jgi:hypothetical protein
MNKLIDYFLNLIKKFYRKAFKKKAEKANKIDKKYRY